MLTASRGCLRKASRLKLGAAVANSNRGETLHRNKTAVRAQDAPTNDSAMAASKDRESTFR